MTVNDAAWAISNGLPENESVSLSCNACGREYDDPTQPQILELIEHVLFEHVSRADVMVTRSAVLVTSNELAQSAGVAARTEAEERWRLAHPLPA